MLLRLQLLQIKGRGWFGSTAAMGGFSKDTEGYSYYNPFLPRNLCWMVWEKLCEIKGRLKEGTTACTSIDETGNVSSRMMIGMNHGEVTHVTATYCLQVTAERCWGFRVLSPEVTKGCAAELLY